MSQYLLFLVLGIGSGAIIAAIALGLVLIHRASGVVHFGYGAVATYVAYVYASLRRDGSYPLPPLPNPLKVFGLVGISGTPDIPAFVAVTPTDSGIVIAAALALVTAVVIGALSHFLVFRPLRYAPELAKIVASVGVMLTLLAAIVLRFGSGSVLVPPVLPVSPVDVLGSRIPQDRFWLLALVIVVTAGLWALFQHTRFGIATRAAAEDERLATLRGVSADYQAGVSWVLASVLAGVFGILVSQVTGLSPLRLTLLVIPALGAALMAGFASFVVAAAAGLGIGMVQSVTLLAQQQTGLLSGIDLPTLLPFLLIAGVLLVKGEALPSRGSIELRRLPDAVAWRIRPMITVVTVGVVAAVAVFAPFEVRAGLTNSMIGVVLALSLVVVTGYVGQVSLAQMSLAGIGAFAAASFAADAGLPSLIAIPAAVVVATIVGLVLSLPSLRTRGASLAVLTLAAAVALQTTLLDQDGWFGTRTQRRLQGPTVGGLDLSPTAPFPLGDGKIPSPAFGLFVLALSTAAVLFVIHLRNSRLGEQMLAVRASERSAAAAGVDVNRVKIAAFALAGALAGLGGVVKAYQLGTFSSDGFGVLASLTLLAYAYLGGISTVGGAMWAGALAVGGLATVATDAVIDLGQYDAYLAGIILIVTAVTSNEGIDGANRAMLRWWRQRRDHGAPAPVTDGVRVP